MCDGQRQAVGLEWRRVLPFKSVWAGLGTLAPSCVGALSMARARDSLRRWEAGTYMQYVPCKQISRSAMMNPPELWQRIGMAMRESRVPVLLRSRGAIFLQYDRSLTNYVAAHARRIASAPSHHSPQLSARAPSPEIQYVCWSMHYGARERGCSGVPWVICFLKYIEREREVSSGRALRTTICFLRGGPH